MKTKILDDVKKVPTIDDKISRAVDSLQDDFPQAATISVEYRYEDAFAIPKYLNQQDYAYAWLDPHDDIQWHGAIENRHFRVVNRQSSCFLDAKAAEFDFRPHGAIERQRMILAYRPTDIENRMRQLPILQHKEMVTSLRSEKDLGKVDLTAEVYNDETKKYARDTKPISAVAAHEEAGEEGLIFNAEEIKI